jgi:quinol monooxygenase YgiN
MLRHTARPGLSIRLMAQTGPLAWPLPAGHDRRTLHEVHTMPQIRLTGHIDVPEARRAAVAAALPEHIRLTRAEPGCRSFDVTADPDVAGRYRVAESFASRADFDVHQQRTGARDWARVSAGIARSYTIEDLEA